MDTLELEHAVALYVAGLPPGEAEESPVKGVDAVA